MKNKTLRYFGVIALTAIVAGTAISQGPQFTAWSELEPVDAVNMPTYSELGPSISHDGLRLYFFRVPGVIYVSHRPDRRSDWGVPVALPYPINTVGNNTTPFESIDGHWLYFASNRLGGVGGPDLWVSYRRFIHDDAAWQEPVNLTAVNSVGFEGGPMLYEDQDNGITQLYFAASPYPGGTQAYSDVYVSNLGPNGFEVPFPVVEINSAAHDGKPWVRRDGLELFFESYRQGYPPLPFTYGSIYSSTRSSIDEPWSPPTVVIGTAASGDPGDYWFTTPSLSRDGLTLFVAANQAGTTDRGDIFVAHRSRLTGKR